MLKLDPKPQGRVRDKNVLRHLHREWKECALCLETCGLSLHHIHRHPRDDVEANLVMLCGHGTAGCHGLVEARDPTTMRELGRYLRYARPDTIAYLDFKLGGAEARQEWMRIQFGR